MISRLLLLVALLLDCGICAESKEESKPANSNLRFMSYDINPKNPKDITVSINDGHRTQFVEVGSRIPKTDFQVQKFERKTRPRTDGTGDEDVSELTLINVETKETKVLSIGQGPINGVPGK